MFARGSSRVDARTRSLIRIIGEAIMDLPNPIVISGHTDSVPFSSNQGYSNWELSAARVASVVRMLSNGGVNPDRLAAVGYGEFRPVADNTTAAGRRANRRVVLLVSRYLDTRHEQIAEPDERIDVMREARTPLPSGTAPASDALQ